jgi:hypothetical protein
VQLSSNRVRADFVDDEDELAYESRYWIRHMASDSGEVQIVQMSAKY